jgi:hypothetical protein
MVAKTELTLYERDFALWIEDMAAKLKMQDVRHLDWDNLVEEIEALGRSEKHELENHLEVLLVHLLKRLYICSEYDYRNWQGTIQEQRNQVKRLLKRSPSLKQHFNEVFEEIYQDALAQVQEVYPQVEFPLTWTLNCEIEILLNEKFWESSQ